LKERGEKAVHLLPHTKASQAAFRTFLEDISRIDPPEKGGAFASKKLMLSAANLFNSRRSQTGDNGRL